MAQATLTGFIRDFTNITPAGVEAYIHPQDASTRGSIVFADSPIRLDIANNGAFSVSLEDRNRYILEILFLDPDRSRIGRSQLHEFRMPVGGGSASNVIGPAIQNGMIRVLQDDPGSSNYEQYHYNEVTGDLFERTA